MVGETDRYFYSEGLKVIGEVVLNWYTTFSSNIAIPYNYYGSLASSDIITLRKGMILYVAIYVSLVKSDSVYRSIIAYPEVCNNMLNIRSQLTNTNIESPLFVCGIFKVTSDMSGKIVLRAETDRTGECYIPAYNTTQIVAVSL